MGDYYENGSDKKFGGGVVYVGGLVESVKREDLEKEFKDCGKMKSIWVAFKPPGFAFIEFENEVDAQEACNKYNGVEIFGSKIKVELSRRRMRKDRFVRGGRGGPGGNSFNSPRGFSGGFQNNGQGGGSGGEGGFRGGSNWNRGRGSNREFYGGGGAMRDKGYNRGYRGGRDFSGMRDGGYGNGASYEDGSRFRSRSPISRERQEFNSERDSGNYSHHESYDQY